MRIVKQIFDIIPMPFPEFIQNRGAHKHKDIGIVSLHIFVSG